VRQLRHRLLQFRHDNSDSTSTQDRKAFVTTVILLATLTFFFLPHTIYFFVSLNTDSSHEDMSAVSSFILVLYMTLLPYLKMITDPLVYGVRMCRRTSAGAPVTSRALYIDAASTAAALRRVPLTSPAVLFCVHRQRRPVNNTYTAVMSSVRQFAGPHSSTRDSQRGRSSVYSTIRLQTIPPMSSVADANVEQML